MRRRSLKNCVHLTILVTVFVVAFTAFGKAGSILFAQNAEGTQETMTATPQSGSDQNGLAQSPSSQETDTQLSNDSSSQEFIQQAAQRTAFLQQIKQQLQSAQSDYLNINRNVKDTQNKLTDVQGQKLTLQDQLDSINGNIANTVMLISNVVMQAQQKESELNVLYQDIDLKNAEIQNQKQMLSEYLKILYEQENSMSDTTNQNNEINIAKLLLSDKSPDEILRELKYFNILENTGHEIFDKLEALLQQQQASQILVENSRNKLEMLYRQLQEEKQTLEVQQQAKAQLLDETKGQESIYQQLLDESIKEQAQSLDDIKSLRDNLKFIQDKIAELGDKFNPDDYKSIFTPETTSVYQYIKSTQNQVFSPSWPVSPSRGISAYYHDEAYRRTMGIPHEAVDVRVPQGTPIHAPADGVIFKAKDNGFGYSYIILAHAGGFMTVYGHVFEIRVTEGEKIKQGQVIGLSGATPGSKGAGLLTTGPHLHFEVLKGGLHVDPLDYLPLAYLPLDSLPQKYLSRITGEQAKVSRTTQESAAAQDSQEIVNMVEANGMFEQTVHDNNPSQFGSGQ